MKHPSFVVGHLWSKILLIFEKTLISNVLPTSLQDVFVFLYFHYHLKPSEIDQYQVKYGYLKI